MKNIYLFVFVLWVMISAANGQTVHQVCVSEAESAGACGTGSNVDGVFTPGNLTINVGDQIEFTTHMVQLGGYSGTHTIEFDGSSANNVSLTISTNALNPTTSITTPPFTTPGVFPMECTNPNHCEIAELITGYNCTGYSVTVLGSGCDVIADFDASEIEICEGEEIQFSNTSQDANSYEWEIDGDQFSTDTDASYTFNSDGTFEIKLIASDGTCSEEITETITVHPNPDANIQLNPTPPILIGQEVEVSFTTSNTDANTSYSWDFCDGNNENHDEDFTYAWDEDGIFCICLTLENDNECSNEICINEIQVEEDGNVNLEQIDAQENVTIFPNPSKGDFTLRFNDQDQLLSLRVVDNQGRLVQSVKYSELKNDNEIAFSVGKSGTYFVVFETNKGFGKKKIIVSQK